MAICKYLINYLFNYQMISMYIIQKFDAKDGTSFHRNINDNGNPQIDIDQIKYAITGEIIYVCIPAYNITDVITNTILTIQDALLQQGEKSNCVIYSAKELANWQEEYYRLAKEAEEKRFCFSGNVFRPCELIIMPVYLNERQNSILEKYPIDQFINDLNETEAYRKKQVNKILQPVLKKLS